MARPKGPPGPRKVELDKDGVPVDRRDWTELDWQDLHVGIMAIKARIARRHARPVEPPPGPR